MADLKVYRHYNFQKNQLQNAVVQPLTSAPSGPTEGQIYYDTTLHQFGVYNASQWVYLAIAGTDTEAVQDIVAGLLTPGTTITATYDDPNNTLTLSIGNGVITNAMVAANAAISADKTADGTTNKVFTATEKTKLAGVATGATAYTDTNARANRLDQFAAPGANVPFAGYKITGLADPTAAQEAATKNYADTVSSSASTADRARANHTGTQTASTISDFDTQVRTSRLDQLAAPTANVSLNGFKLTSVADPTAASDVVTKGYADGLRQGLSIKDPVLVATTGNVTLSGEQTIDGVLTSSSRVLVKANTTASQNGIYVTGSGAWTRAVDADGSGEIVQGTAVWVQQGTQAGRWAQTAAGPITLGTTAQTWTMDFAATSTTAGAGLTAAGNVFNVGAGAGVSVSADAIAIDATVVVQKKVFSIGDGSALSFTVTHNLNTRNITAALMDSTTFELVDAQITATTVNTATVSLNGTPPASGAFQLTVHG